MRSPLRRIRPVGHNIVGSDRLMCFPRLEEEEAYGQPG